MLSTNEKTGNNGFSIIEAALKKVGSSLENMLRIRVYVFLRSEFEEIKLIIGLIVRGHVLQYHNYM